MADILQTGFVNVFGHLFQGSTKELQLNIWDMDGLANYTHLYQISCHDWYSVSLSFI